MNSRTGRGFYNELFNHLNCPKVDIWGCQELFLLLQCVQNNASVTAQSYSNHTEQGKGAQVSDVF